MISLEQIVFVNLRLVNGLGVTYFKQPLMQWLKLVSVKRSRSPPAAPPLGRLGKVFHYNVDRHSATISNLCFQWLWVTQLYTPSEHVPYSEPT